MSSAGRDFNLAGGASPGPGAYDTYRSSLNKKGYAVSKTGRTPGAGESVPGPGQYETAYSSLNKKGAGKIASTGHGDLYSKEANPGPLDYDPYSHEKGFGKGVRIPAAGRQGGLKYGEGGQYTPGPGDYDTNKTSLRKNGYAVSKTGRSIFNKDYVPGPGDYETSVSSFTKRGVARIGNAPERSAPLSSTPGPLDYDPYAADKKKGGVTIPRSGRNQSGPDGMPGPADYDSHVALDHLKKRGGGYAPTKATLNGAKDSTPGPADYDYAKSSLSKKGQAFIPKSGRRGLGDNGVPGPADYDTQHYYEKGWKKGISIPHAKKPGADGTTPGPGQYDFIPSVPDVPAYLLPNQEKIL